jgi:RNA polymerase sigma-70 factor (ECF subfamily)
MTINARKRCERSEYKDVSDRRVRRDGTTDSPVGSAPPRNRRDAVSDEVPIRSRPRDAARRQGVRRVDERRAGSRTDEPSEEWIHQLFEEHGRAMLAYATRLTGEHTVAEDMAQEAIIRAWRHLDGPVEGKTWIRAWLFRVIRNLVIDRARARNARGIEVAATPMINPVERDHADRVVDSVLVVQALDSLSPEHRTILEEIYFKGYTMRETAQKLGIPLGTVKSRSYAALRSLRQLLRVPLPNLEN